MISLFASPFTKLTLLAFISFSASLSFPRTLRVVAVPVTPVALSSTATGAVALSL